jgi:hypothetical protein
VVPFSGIELRTFSLPKAPGRHKYCMVSHRVGSCPSLTEKFVCYADSFVRLCPPSIESLSSAAAPRSMHLPEQDAVLPHNSSDKPTKLFREHVDISQLDDQFRHVGWIITRRGAAARTGQDMDWRLRRFVPKGDNVAPAVWIRGGTHLNSGQGP